MDTSSCCAIWSKIPRRYVSAAVVFLLLLIAATGVFFIYKLESEKKSDQGTNSQPGIAFETFWQRLQQESVDFLQGTTLYVADVESVNAANFTKNEGRAGMWVAIIVRCGYFMGQIEASASGQLICVGDSAKASLADTALTGMANTLAIAVDEQPFSGPVVKASDIAIGASQAEMTANQSKSHTTVIGEDYYYRFTIEGSPARPVWNVLKTCSKSVQNSCDPSDDWSVRIDAGTGTPL